MSDEGGEEEGEGEGGGWEEVNRSRSRISRRSTQSSPALSVVSSSAQPPPVPRSSSLTSPSLPSSPLPSDGPLEVEKNLKNAVEGGKKSPVVDSTAVCDAGKDTKTIRDESEAMAAPDASLPVNECGGKKAKDGNSKSGLSSPVQGKSSPKEEECDWNSFLAVYEGVSVLFSSFSS